MSLFSRVQGPSTPLGLHRSLSPTASIKVSPLCLGGISIGSSWSPTFGANEDPFTLLDTFVELGGNFIDTSNVYNSEDSEKLIGEWMESRGVRDQMVVATKYSSGYKYHDDRVRFMTNYTGNSAKSMYVSVRDSLRKLRTEYIDILCKYDASKGHHDRTPGTFADHPTFAIGRCPLVCVEPNPSPLRGLLMAGRWDFGTSVEEVMRHLHALVMARQVLYLGVSDTPAWVVVKANACKSSSIPHGNTTKADRQPAVAKANGLTPFSVYQGSWSAAQRDMEGEIIPMCQDQGLAVVPWASLGGGQLLSSEQRQKLEADPNQAGRQKNIKQSSIQVSDTLEAIASEKKTTLQAIALAYLLSQYPHTVPLVGVQKVEHIKAMPAALEVDLSDEDIARIHKASPYDPGFPMTFLFNFRGDQPYHLGMGEKDVQQYNMWAVIGGPPKQQRSR